MKKSKVVVSVILMVSLIISQMVCVSASQAKTHTVIADSFETFGNYENSILPDGWEKAVDCSELKYEYTTDSETNSKVIHFKQNMGKIAIPFAEVLKNGKIYVSFDVKTVNDTHLIFGSHISNNSSSNNVRDYSYKGLNGGLEEACVEYYKRSYGTSTSWIGGSMPADDLTWHKVELFVDLDAKIPTATMYYDGGLLGEPQNIVNCTGLKDFYFYGNGLESWIDNMCIKQYADVEDYNSTITLENSSTNSVDICFSEAIVAENVTASDFAIKDSSGIAIDVANYTAVKKGNSRVQISFNNVNPGAYKIEVVGNLLRNNNKPANKLHFYINGSVNYDSNLFYLNENFDYYEGGTPTDWYGFIEPVALDDMQSITGKEGKALQLKDLAPIAFDFKNPLETGDYTIEFDVKNANGWCLNILDEAMTKYKSADQMKKYMYQSDYDTQKKKYIDAGNTEEQWAQYVRSEEFDTIVKSSWKNKKISTVLMGQAKGENAGYYFHPYKGNSLPVEDTYKIADNTGTEWTHIKLELQTGAGKCIITVGNNDPVTKTYTNNIYSSCLDRVCLVSRETGYREFVHGIGGIAFRCLDGSKTGSLGIDNVKVYKNNQYNAYQNFDNFEKGKPSQGWYLPTQDYNGSRRLSFVNDAFVATVKNDTDKYIAISNLGNNIANVLDVPVKAGQPFAIEFDVNNMSDDPSTAEKWKFGFFTEKMSFSNKYTVDSGKTAQNGEIGIAGIDWQNNDTQFSVLRRTWTEAEGAYFTLGGFRNGSFKKACMAGGETPIPCYDNEWANIKLDVVPLNVGFKLKFTINYPSRQENYTTDWQEFNVKGSTLLEIFDVTEDIYAVGFRMENGKKYGIDNLKVYETNIPSITSIAETNVLHFDGTKEALGSVLPVTTKGIKLSFSAPLKNTDGISVEYTDGTEIEHSVSLSNDKKEVEILFTELPDLEKTMTLGLSQNIKFDTASNLSGLQSTSKSFGFDGSSSVKIDVSDYRVYEKLGGDTIKYIEKYSGTEKEVAIPTGWYPVIGSSLENKDLNNLKLVISGFNPGAGDKIFAVVAGYNTDGTILNIAIPGEFEPVRGMFDNLEIEFSDLSEVENNNIKCFVWNQDYAPFGEQLEYVYSSTVNE